MSPLKPGTPSLPLSWDSARIHFPFRYSMGSDPAHWLAVHPETGIITAKAPLDRESPFVQNNTYRAILLTEDDGKHCWADEGAPPPLVAGE